MTTTTPSPPQTAGGWARYLAIQSAPQSSADVVFLGDSLISNWPSRLLSGVAPGHSVANWGVPGDRTQQVLWRLQQPEVSSLRPKVVVLLIGTNNLSARDDSCGIVEGISAILARINALWQKPPVLLITIPPRGQGLDFRAEDRREIAAALQAASQQNVTFIDWDAELRREPSAYRPDQTHFTYRGYEYITPFISMALSSIFSTDKN